MVDLSIFSAASTPWIRVVEWSHIRFGVLCRIFCMPVQCLPQVRGLVPFEEGEQAGNTDYGAHDVVHVSGFDDHVRPVKAMFEMEVSAKPLSR